MNKVKNLPDLSSPAYWNGTIKMSLSKFFILCVMQNRSMHGYEVTKAVEVQSDGCCSPTEGAIYPILKEFEAGGYATCESKIVSGRERKVYTITEKGREAYSIALGAWLNVAKCLEQCQFGDGNSSCCDDES